MKKSPRALSLSLDKFRKLFPLVLLLFIVSCPLFAHAATFTSTQTGNWSDTATWGGGGIPGAGDRAIISSGNTVTVDQDTIIGSTSTPLGGPSITINGTNSSTFGTLNVASGVTLTIRGVDRSTNVEMKINQYGTFQPQPGSTIIQDCPTDGTCFISNNGIVNAVGTSGSPITWKGSPSSVNWNNTTTTTQTGVVTTFDPAEFPNINTFALKPWISNAGGTGIGSLGDSSVSITASSTGEITQEVGSLTAVNGIGKYYIDYDKGVIYWYHTTGNLNFTAIYKVLTFTGGTIQSSANTTYNEGVFSHVNFQYMGTIVNTSDWILGFANKQSDTVSGNTHRKMTITNDTFRYTKGDIGWNGPITGSSGDPILITGNTFYNAGFGGLNAGNIIMAFRAASSYVSFSNNFVSVSSAQPVITTSAFGSVTNQSNWSATNNYIEAATFMSGSPMLCDFPGLVVNSNVFKGFGSAYDGRMFLNVWGTAGAGNRVTITNNVFIHAHRLIMYGSYDDFTNNYMADTDHHGFVGTGIDDTLVSSVNIADNILQYSSAGPIMIGYNHRQWVDDITVKNNTIAYFTTNNRGIEFGDSGDAIGYANLGTGVKTYDNLITGVLGSAGVGAYENPDISNLLTRFSMTRADYQAFYALTSTYGGILNQFATFMRNGSEYNPTGGNITGVSLWNPTYSTPQSGMSLVWTYTSSTDVTLAWGGGTAVQLFMYNGSPTGTATNNTNNISGTLADTTKTFPTSLTNTATPIGAWVVITGGTGAGQVRRITNTSATQLTVVPAWTTLPDTSSTYVIYKSQVQLTDSGGTDSVYAGIDFRSTPVSSQTDSGISIAFNSISANPSFVDQTRTWKTWDASLGGAGTEESASTRLSADPSLVASSLLPYIRAGYTPTNPVLSAASFDGSTIGAEPYNDIITPSVELTAPSSGATISGASVALTASSTDDVKVVGVKFYYSTGGNFFQIGSELTATTSSPYGYDSTWNTTGVTNGTYSLVAVARDGAGHIATSSAISVTVNNATVPGSPTSPSATAGDAQASVSFTAPVSDGGSAITQYEVFASGGGVVAYGASSPITVTGLTNNQAYTFAVVAANAVGTSTLSASSTPVTPVPGIATTYTFTGPSSGNAGSASTNFTVTPNGTYTGTITLTPSGGGSTGLSATVLTFSNSSSAQTFTYTPTVAGTLTLTPTNNSSLTNPSNLSYTVNAVAPNAPTGVSGTAASGQSVVSFSAPAFNGGSAITGYTVYSSNGGTDTNAGSTGLSHTVTGLTNGSPYTFVVRATNIAGTSVSSASSSPVTPGAVPDAPTSVSAVKGNAQATVSFTAPSNNGYSIIDYTVTSSPGNNTATGSASPITVTGLTNGTAYTFTVTARNSQGSGSPSSASNSATPSTVPTTPTGVTGTSGDGQISVSFTSSNGGAATTYYVSATVGSTTATGSASPIVVTGLTNGQDYQFTVRGVNINGSTASSTPSASTTPAVGVVSTPTTSSNGAPVFSGGSVIPIIPPRQEIISPDGTITYLDTGTTNTPSNTSSAVLQSQITTLLATLTALVQQAKSLGISVSLPASLPTSLPSLPTSSFTRDLSLGSTGSDVQALQSFLNLHGYPVSDMAGGPGSLGHETTLFGVATQAALSAYQKDHGIQPSIGYFGSVTRRVMGF